MKQITTAEIESVGKYLVNWRNPTYKTSLWKRNKVSKRIRIDTFNADSWTFIEKIGKKFNFPPNESYLVRMEKLMRAYIRSHNLFKDDYKKKVQNIK